MIQVLVSQKLESYLDSFRRPGGYSKDEADKLAQQMKDAFDMVIAAAAEGIILELSGN